MPDKEKIEKLIVESRQNEESGCAAKVIYILGQLFHIEIEEQVNFSLIGLEGGSNFKMDCGLLDGTLIFIGIMLSQQGLSIPFIEGICRQFTAAYEIKFGEANIPEAGYNKTDCPHISLGNINFIYQFIKGIAGESNTDENRSGFH